MKFRQNWKELGENWYNFVNYANMGSNFQVWNNLGGNYVKLCFQNDMKLTRIFQNYVKIHQNFAKLRKTWEKLPKCEIDQILLNYGTEEKSFQNWVQLTKISQNYEKIEKSFQIYVKLTKFSKLLENREKFLKSGGNW